MKALEPCRETNTRGNRPRDREGEARTVFLGGRKREKRVGHSRLREKGGNAKLGGKGGDRKRSGSQRERKKRTRKKREKEKTRTSGRERIGREKSIYIAPVCEEKKGDGQRKRVGLEDTFPKKGKKGKMERKGARHFCINL